MAQEPMAMAHDESAAADETDGEGAVAEDEGA
jgi:hypothetical protein